MIQIQLNLRGETIKKSLSFLGMIMLIFLIIGAVSAADAQDGIASSDDADSLSSNDIENVLEGSEADVDDGNFASLDNAIQNVDDGGTVHLNTNVTLNDGTTGEEETYVNGIAIDKDVTINGYNQIINATDSNGNGVRLFTVNSGKHLTLKDLTITGASYIGDGNQIGGAITVNGGILTLINVNFTNNYAQMTANNKVGAGCVMVYNGGTANITGGSFVNNTIKYDQAPASCSAGAAINVNQGSSNLYVDGTYFENNEAIFAKVSNEAGGAAISSINSVVSIINSKFVNNRVTFDGAKAIAGAVYAIPNTRVSKIVNSTFLNNSAYSVGALYFRGNYFNVTGCVFEDNDATDSIITKFENGGEVHHNAFTDGKISTNQYVNENKGENWFTNWYGTNDVTDVGFELTNWVVMTMEHDDTHIIVKLTSLNDGSSLSDTYLLPTMEATITGLGETRKVKIVGGVGTLTLDESITEFAGNTVNVTVNDQSFSFVVNDKTKSFSDLENNIINTPAGETYDLKGDFQLNAGVTGEEVTYAEGIVINKDITIDGHGLTINATDANGNKVRIFKITNGATVTLKDIILAGGFSDNGGAILVDDATLTANGVTFTGNSATNGGAVYSNNGDVTIVNSTFVKNTATSAGAIQIENGKIEGSIFEDNSASSASAAILGNGADANYNIFLNGQTVSGNGNFDYNWWKTNSPENVGVTLNNWIVMNVTNDDKIIKVSLNKLNTGESIANPEKFPSVPVAILWDDVVKELTLENGIVTVEFDKAVTYDSKYNITVKIYDIEENYTLKPIFSENNNFDQLNSIIKDADENDVINLDADVRLNEVNINEETDYKTGIVIDKSITIDGNGHIINALDANGNKVRIFNINNANVTLKNIVLANASVASPGGAAIYINGGSLTLVNVTLIDNAVTALTGAALSAINAQVNVTNSSFINNTLTKTDTTNLGGGAAIYLDGGSLDVYNSLFEGNRYNGYAYSSARPGGGGGAIYTTTATTNIFNSRFIRNSAIRTGGSGELVGGALLIKTGILKGNVFEENTATSAPNTMRVTDATAIVNYNAFIGTQTVAGSANYNANWWGTNNPSAVGVTLANWLVLSYTIDGKEISATINSLNDGNSAEETSYIPTRVANITIEGASEILNTTNGVATVTLDNELTIGTSYQANATIDSQTISFVIKPNIENISANIISNATIGVNGTVNVELTGIEGVNPIGTVTLWLDNNEYTIDLTDGAGTIDLGYNLVGGDYNVYIRYNGDENYAESEKIKLSSVFKVNKLNSTIKLDSDVVYKGVATYIYVSVSDDFATPTGEVTVTINGIDVTKSLVNGKVFIPVGDDLSFGIHDVIVKYSGDSKFNNVTVTLPLNVTKINVGITAELARDTIDEGNNVTMTVTVTPEGVVYYYDKPLFSIDKTATSTSSLIKVTSASSTIYGPTASIVANGIRITSPSSGASTLIKDSAVIFPQIGSLFQFKYVSSTNFRLYAFTGKTWASNIGYLSYSSSAYKFWPRSGTSSTFSGFEAPKEGDIFKVTIENRIMTFYVNDDVLGSVSVSNDELYFGIYTYKGSTTIVDDVKVDKLGREPTQATYNPTILPNGTITVKIGSIEKTVEFDGGKASFDIGDALTKGIYTAEVKYEGNDNYFNASTTSSQLTVKRMEKPTIEIVAPETCELGKNITISVEITGVDEPITGKFNVTVGDIVKTAYAENGILTFDAGYNFTAGNHTIYIYYDGDENYLFASENVSFVINMVDTTLDVDGGVTIIVGNDAIISIKVNPINGVIPTGEVTIISDNVNKNVELDANGEATYNIGADLPVGVHDVYVEYNGDVNYNKINTTVESMYTAVNVIYVNATSGSDEEGTGFADKPFKSIKKAINTLNGNGTIILNGVFTGSDNIGISLSKSKMINIDIVGNDAVIDAEMTRTSMFTINKVNVRFINVTLTNPASSTSTYGCLINVADADYLDIINSTISNIYVQNGKSSAIYLADYDVKLGILNSKFDSLESNVNGLISTNSVNQGLSNARNEIYIDNSSFNNFKSYSAILISSSNAFGAGASAVITNSVFTNMKGAQATYSSFAQLKSLNMSNCIISDMDFNSRWTWININEGNLDYNFWSSNDPDFSHVTVKPNNWIVMTWDNESTVFTVTLNTLNDGSAYENISLLTVPVTFSDNLDSDVDKLDENGVASATLNKELKVGEKVSATIGSLTMSLSFRQDIENMTYDVVNTVRWENGTITITVNGKDDIIPTGEVTIWVNDVPYTVDLNDGVATLNVGDDLAVGNYITKAQYNGDINYFSSDVIEFIFSVEKTNVDVSVIADSLEYGQKQVISLVLTSDKATGNFTVLVNNKPYAVNVSEPELDLGILDAGDYEVIVTYLGDENFNTANNKSSFTISKKSINPVLIYNESIKVGQNQIIELLFSDYDEDAIVKLEINGNVKFQSISDNKAVFNISDLKEGVYSFNLTYEGTNYVADMISNAFEVFKTSLDISAHSINASAGNNVFIVISGIPTDATGIVVVSVDGTVYGTNLVDGNYVAVIPALKVGNSTADVSFKGDEKYNPASTSVNFTVTKLDVNVDVNAEDSKIVISAPEATGDLIVIVDDEVNTIPLIDGTATYELENNSYGDHNLVVIYNGVVSHVSQFTIDKLDTAIEANADPIDIGDDAVIVVTVNETATGSVIVDGKYYGEIEDGVAIINVPNLTNGTHTLSVKYSGDERFNEADTSVDVVVNKLVPSIEINAESIELGEEAYIEVTLSDGATGTVTVYVGDSSPIVSELENGKAYIYVPDLANGTYDVRVVYSGDDVFAGNESTAQFDVKYDIEIEGETVYGQDSIIYINLPDEAEGNVAVTVDNKTFVAVVEDGCAVVNLSTLDYGAHEVTVAYSGDDKYPAKTITDEIFVDANIDIPDEVPYNGGEICIKLPSNATGNVTVTIDNDTTIIVSVENGAANIPLDNLTMGDHDISVVYSGDDNYKPVSVNDSLTVNPNIKVPDELTTGDNEISIDLPADASGNLTVTVDGKEIVVPVVNGTASVPISDLSAGDHDISVEYSGDDKYDSFYKSLNGNVAKITPSTNVTVPKSITAGKANTISINLPKDATGIVLVDVAGNKYYANAKNGVAKVNIAGLTAGNKQLTYNYLGDAKYNAFEGDVTLKVVKPTSKAANKVVLKSKNVKVKKSAKKLVLKATLKINGKVVKGKKITFKFKGKKYTAKTNKKGVAKVKIKKKVIKKLKKGKKYKFKVTYLKTKITKKVKVKK